MEQTNWPHRRKISMRWLPDMITKYGFSDGEAIPGSAPKRRAIYVDGLNATAERLGLGIRADVYNRAGFHNWCMIQFFDADGVRDFIDPSDPDVQLLIHQFRTRHER